MMSEKDMDIEALISRTLDGEASDDEQLELNRRLIRDPAAQQDMEDARRVDAMASEAMRSAFSDDQLGFDPDDISAAPTRKRSRHFPRGAWLIPGAIAAAVLAMVIPYPNMQPTSAPSPGSGTVTFVDGPIESSPSEKPTVIDRPVPLPQVGGDTGVMRNVDWNLPRTRRTTGREVIGVVGDDGNVYWLEVNRSRVIRQPSPQAERIWNGGGV